jgi:hypothetical protein
MNLAEIIEKNIQLIAEKRKIIDESKDAIEELKEKITKIVPPITIASRTVKLNQDGELAFYRERQNWPEFVLKQAEMKVLNEFLRNYYETQLPE